MTMETTSFNGNQISQSSKSLGFVSKLALQTANQIGKAVSYLNTRRQQVIDRLAFKNLLTLEANILQDIGVSREDVIWASKLPLSKNAALELEKIARPNRRAKPE